MRSLLLALGGLLGLVACFGDTQQPSAFRFECSADADCNDPEQCIAGLCQIPCALLTFDDDCPSDQEYVSCVNGVCSHLCEFSSESACPAAQTCLQVLLDPGMYGGGGVDISKYGVCGMSCSADSCPDAETCVEGLCWPIDTGDTGDTGDTTTGGTGN